MLSILLLCTYQNIKLVILITKQLYTNKLYINKPENKYNTLSVNTQGIYNTILKTLFISSKKLSTHMCRSII